MHWLRQLPLWMCVALVSVEPQASALADGPANNDEAAVRGASRNYVAAMQRGDAESLKSMWTEHGDYVNADGRASKGRDLVGKLTNTGKHSAAAPASPASKLRFVTPDVAIEDGAYDCDTDANSPPTGRFTAIWVKRNGKWLLDSLREATNESPAAAASGLKSLDWMLGEWVGHLDDNHMLISARLSDSGKYIIREFAVIGAGGEATATERLTWDAERGQLRSWTFDSQDGRGESRWIRDGKGWRIETDETKSDGSTAITTSKIVPLGPEQFQWEVISAEVDDKPVPSKRVVFTRATEGR